MMNDKELEQETRAVLDLVEGLTKARATAERSLAETLKLILAANVLEDQLRVRAAKLDAEVAASRTLARAGMLVSVAHIKTAEELKRNGECDCAVCSLRATYTSGASMCEECRDGTCGRCLAWKRRARRHARRKTGTKKPGVLPPKPSLCRGRHPYPSRPPRRSCGRCSPSLPSDLPLVICHSTGRGRQCPALGALGLGKPTKRIQA